MEKNTTLQLVTILINILLPSSWRSALVFHKTDQSFCEILSVHSSAMLYCHFKKAFEQ